MIAAIIAAVLVVPPPAGTDVNRILSAIAAVETGGERQPDRAVGDNGKALGRFQIWEVYWKDACEYDKSLRSRPYTDVTDPEYARRVVIAYLSRYAQDWSIDTVSRIHNGGPRGATGKRRRATDGYAAKAAKEYSRCDT
jgi:hypothetical protein